MEHANFMFVITKLITSQIDACVRQNLTMVHWIRLSLLCRCKRTRKSQVWYGNVSKQYLLLCQNKRVYCACTRFLCMHNTLVAPGRTRGCFFLGPGLGPWPLQCMHKSVVHAQESCACTRILCRHNIPFHSHRIIYIALKHFYMRGFSRSCTPTQ